MSNDRPAIPTWMKKEVRRVCGFGCVLCGKPFFQYDHIVDYAEVNEHTVDNLALLCPNHHSGKTGTRIPREIVAEKRKSPFNRGKDKTTRDRGDWFFSGETLTLIVGTNSFSFDLAKMTEIIAVQINELVVLGIKYVDGDILLTAKFHNEIGQEILTIIEGEIVVSTEVFDYNMVGPVITIKHEDGTKLLELTKKDNGIVVSHGRFCEGRTQLLIEPKDLSTVPRDIFSMRGVISTNCAIGLHVHGPTFPASANDQYY